MKQNLGELKPKTYGSYTDSRGRTIVANYKKRIAYILQKEDEKKYNILTNRFSLAIAIMMLTGFYWNWIGGVVIGIIAFIALEYYYHVTFLGNMQTVENVDFPPRKDISTYAREMPQGRRVLLFAMLLAFSILLIVNMFLTVKDWNSVFTFKDMNNVVMAVFSVGISVFALYMAVKVFAVIIEKKETV